MKTPISDITDLKGLRNLMANAERLGRDDVRREAFQRICELVGLNLHELTGMDRTDPLHRDFCNTLAAYEELLTEKNGKTTQATRTRQKLRNKGLVRCLEDWAVSSEPTEGFELLIKNDLAGLTGEYLVLKYPGRFSDKAVAAAEERLLERDVAIPGA